MLYLQLQKIMFYSEAKKEKENIENRKLDIIFL